MSNIFGSFTVAQLIDDACLVDGPNRIIRLLRIDNHLNSNGELNHIHVYYLSPFLIR